jgi:hypothetical protein
MFDTKNRIQGHPLCYSAQVESKWNRYVRDIEARWDLSAFNEPMQLWLTDPRPYRLPRREVYRVPS